MAPSARVSLEEVMLEVEWEMWFELALHWWSGSWLVLGWSGWEWLVLTLVLVWATPW